MKALSLRPDYAFDVLDGKKSTEYRSWKTNYRGDLLICSTQKKIPGTIPGHALIVCELNDIEPAPGGYAWILTNFRTIHPFKVKGARRLFDVDDSLIKFTGFKERETDPARIKAAEDWVKKEIIPLIS
jgi:hypothetical protein